MHGTLPRKRLQVVRRDDTWTYSESEVVRKHWPAVTIIRQMLPHRSEAAIRMMAKRCGILPDKVQHIWTMPEDTKLRKHAAEGLSTKEIATALGLSERQVAGRLQYKKIQIAKRRPSLTGDPLLDAIRQRAFDLSMSLIDLDRSLGRQPTFQKASAKRPISPAIIAQAAAALGGKLVVEWEQE